MEEQYNIEEIEQYLAGELTGAALVDFESRLAQDAGLAAKVRLVQGLDDTLADEQALKVQQLVVGLGEEFFAPIADETKAEVAKEKPTVRLPLYRRPYAIAAGLAILVSLGLFFWWQSATPPLSSQELFASYYQAYENTALVRGPASTNDQYQTALDQYDQGDFTSASTILDTILTQQPGDISARFVLAHAYFNQTPPNTEAAIQALQFIIEDGKSILLPQVQWYLALIYLKQDQGPQAQALLQQLLNSPDTQLAQQAQKLLQEMEN